MQCLSEGSGSGFNEGMLVVLIDLFSPAGSVISSASMVSVTSGLVHRSFVRSGTDLLVGACDRQVWLDYHNCTQQHGCWLSECFIVLPD